MKRVLALTAVLFVLYSLVTACSIAYKDTQIKDKLDLSKVSFKLKIEDAYMTKDFGLYGEVKNTLGIVLHGNVEKGKITEGSEINFVDENGNVFYNDKVFKIIIIEVNTGTEQKSRQQSYAESSDDVSIYLRFNEDDYINNDSKYSNILDKIRKSTFVVSNHILVNSPIVPIIISAIILIGMCLLQAFLSIRKNKFLGLLLPTISFGYFIFNIFIFVNVYLAQPKAGTYNTYDELGHLSSTFTIENVGFNYESLFLLCLITIIPIAIQLTIYFICRAKFKKRIGLNGNEGT